MLVLAALGLPASFAFARGGGHGEGGHHGGGGHGGVGSHHGASVRVNVARSRPSHPAARKIMTSRNNGARIGNNSGNRFANNGNPRTSRSGGNVNVNNGAA